MSTRILHYRISIGRWFGCNKAGWPRVGTSIAGVGNAPAFHLATSFDSRYGMDHRSPVARFSFMANKGSVMKSCSPVACPRSWRTTEQVVVVCEPRLAPLLARSFPTAVVHGVGRGREHLWTAPASPPIDVQSPIGDLPRHLRSSLASFSKRDAFLRANPARVQFWRDRLARLGPGPKIGIAWRAGSRPQDRLLRSAPLSHWRSLLKSAGTQFISLEYGGCQSEIETCRKSCSTLHTLPDINPQDNLDELAATISALDLVVSVGNASVHLAGALGVPTWALLPRYQGWCWPADGARMPWYTSVRVFRQEADGDWPGLLARVEAEFLNWRTTNSDYQTIGA